ncbi:MAG TPA: hypothetical protein VIG54_08365 [Lysobacter sp.]
MRNLVLAFALLAVAAVPAHAARRVDVVLEEPVLATRVDGKLEIDTNGAVVGFTPTTEMKPSLAESLRAMVMRWRFEPVVVDGRVVRAIAPVRLSLSAAPREDGAFEMKIEHLTFPEETDGRERDGTESRILAAKAVRRTPVAYPQASLRAGVSGSVLVAVRMSEGGDVLDAVARQTALYNVKGSDRRLAPFVADLEAASVRAVRRWKFDLTLAPDAPRDAETLTGFIAFVYTIEGSGTPEHGNWTWEARTLGRPVPWLGTAVADRIPNVEDVGVDGTFGVPKSRYRRIDDGTL